MHTYIRRILLFAFAFVLLGPAVAIAADVSPLDGLRGAFDAVRAAKATGDMGLVTPLLAALFALVMRQVISLYHAWRPISDRTRDFLPYVCVGFGVAFALLSRLWVGLDWSNAFTYGLVGPLAIAWNELIGKHADIKAAPPVDAVATLVPTVTAAPLVASQDLMAALAKGITDGIVAHAATLVPKPPTP